MIGSRELAGKVVLITGAAAGIGRAIATELAKAGGAIVGFDRDDSAALVSEVIDAGGRAIGVQGDVTVKADLAMAAALATDAFGGVDILVNNAGLFATLKPAPFETITAEQWRQVMDVNVLGGVLAAQAVVESMRARGGGRIVNVASTTAFKGVAYLLHYTSSKGAILAMTKALARELAPDSILVNAIAPGFTISDGVEQHSDHVEAMRQRAPGGRVLSREMRPHDLVGAVRFLVGPMSEFVTGQTLVVDGGAYFH